MSVRGTPRLHISAAAQSSVAVRLEFEMGCIASLHRDRQFISRRPHTPWSLVRCATRAWASARLRVTKAGAA